MIIPSKLIETQEALISEFEQKRKQAEDVAEAKTAKNRAKRQKKKERAKRGKSEEDTKQDGTPRESTTSDLPLKKRRLINGKELVFRKPGEESDSEPDEGPQPHETSEVQMPQSTPENAAPVPAAEEAKITIHEDD